MRLSAIPFLAKLPAFWRLMKNKIHRSQLEVAGEADEDTSEPEIGPRGALGRSHYLLNINIRRVNVLSLDRVASGQEKQPPKQQK